jgi:hypothetical protein
MRNLTRHRTGRSSRSQGYHCLSFREGYSSGLARSLPLAPGDGRTKRGNMRSASPSLGLRPGLQIGVVADLGSDESAAWRERAVCNFLQVVFRRLLPQLGAQSYLGRRPSAASFGRSCMRGCDLSSKAANRIPKPRRNARGCYREPFASSATRSHSHP